MNPTRRTLLSGAVSALATSGLGACAKDYAMGTTTQTTQLRMSQLFERSKWMCFGRYALELPQETEQVFGSEEINAGFKVFASHGKLTVQDVLEQQWQATLRQDRRSVRLTKNSPGPVPNASHFWFYDGTVARKEDMRMLDGAIAVGSNLYLFRAASSRYYKLSPELIFSNMTALMRGMRAWDGVEVPREPGVCIEGAFIHEPTNRFQEIMSSGFYFPSLPDVSFSVSSNKNASTEGPNGVGLLEGVESARRNPALALVGGLPLHLPAQGQAHAARLMGW